MTAAPSQTSEAAGLEVVAWDYRTAPHRKWHRTENPGIAEEERAEGNEVVPYSVTAASAQAAIDAEKAKVAELEAQLDAAMSAGAHEFDGRKAEKARADRLAKALEAARGTLDAIDCPLTTDRTVAGAAKHAVKRIDAALQQETQK